jgi:hypothetical protein
MLHKQLCAAARIASAIIASSTLVVIGASAAVPASAATTAVRPADTVLGSGWYGMDDAATNHCLDSNAAGDVYTTKPCQVPGNQYQDWEWTEYQATSSSGATYEFYSLRDEATGRCLDSNAAGSLYTTKPCQAPGNPYQDWYITSPNQIWWFIRNVATGLNVDSNAAGNAYTNTYNGGNFQAWSHFQ